jgi:hypothetical protein
MQNIVFMILFTITVNQIGLSNCSLSNKENLNSFLNILKNPLLPEGYFNIVGKTGLCISAKYEINRLTQQECGNDDHLLWKYQKQNDGYVILSKNGLVIDIYEGKNFKGSPVVSNTRNNGFNQIWVVESVKNGNHIHFRNPQTNRCLDDTGRAKKNNGYYIWSCRKTNKNQWFNAVSFEPTKPVVETKHTVVNKPVVAQVPVVAPLPVIRVSLTKKLFQPEGYFNIVGKTGLCVSAVPAVNHNGRLTQRNCGNDDHLVWSAQKQNNGLVIQSKNGMVMDNISSQNRNGNLIIGSTRHNGQNQIWVIESVQNANHYHFRNPQTNRCLDDTGLAKLGNIYHIWDCSNGNRNQWFRIQPVEFSKPVIQTKPIQINVSVAERTGSLPAPTVSLTLPILPTPILPVAPIAPLTPTVPVISTKPFIITIPDLDPIPYFKPLEGNIDISTLRN